MSTAFSRVTTAPFLTLVPLVLLGGISITAILRADEPPPPASGEVRLASGRVVDFTIHFDRNSLRDSLRVGDCLIALTSSGALLRFELPAVRLVRERVDEEVTCIGLGEGGTVLAGLGDGRVCRVGPVTLELTEVARLPSAPSWVGWCKAGGNRPAGVVGLTQKTKRMEQEGEQWDEPFSVVHNLATGKTCTLEYLVTTVLLDRASRLWLGADKGEFGGHVSRIDLATGIVTTIKPPPSHDRGEAYWAGVYGFIELRDGQVWAYGGTSHMGFNRAYISRVDEGKEARTMAAFDPPPKLGQKPDQSRPSMPITHMIEEKGGLLVFSFSDVFRVDRALKNWHRIGELRVHYRWGRPDAVGSYPAVRSVNLPNREGEPFMLATIDDGIVVVDGQKSISRALAGQLAAPLISAITNSSEGTFYSGNDWEPTWRLGWRGWKIAELAPPMERDPADRRVLFEKIEEEWYETRVLAGPSGMIYTVSGAGATRTTARRVDGKAVRLGRETSELEPASSFITADGTLWNCVPSRLRRFQDGRWETVHRLAAANSPYGRIKPVNADGPPWMLLQESPPGLWQLDHGAKGENPRLTKIEVQESGKALVVEDAIPWSDGTLLLATHMGLRTYAPTTHTLSAVDLPEPPQPATKLVRDGLGRLWCGGERGLALSEPGAKIAETLDCVPWVGRSRVHALAPDPQHADGVIVALGSRGVAFVRARQTR